MKKVLFIDDSEENLNLYKIYFKKNEDLDVVYISSPKEGLEVAKEKEFDLIFLDLQMPELSGWEILDELKEVKNNAYIVALTASNDTTTIDKIDKSDFDDFLTKPILKKDLINFVDKK